LLAGREEHPTSLRSLAQLRIAQGEPRIAASLLERGLHATEGAPVRTTQLLAPLVDARLACGDIAGAAAAAAQLAELAEESGGRLVAGRAELAAARVALGQRQPAAEAARRALVAFTELATPHDAGEARLALARALRAEEPDMAREEAH